MKYFFSFLFFPLLLSAQSNNAFHWRISTQTGDLEFRKVLNTPDRGYIALCYTTATDSLGDVALVKFDSTWLVEWSRALGTNLKDRPVDFVRTLDGGYAICGETFSSYASGTTDGLLIKTDGTGYPMWSRRFGNPDNDKVSGIVEMNNGNLAVSSKHSWYPYVTCFTANGQDVFCKRYTNTPHTLYSRGIYKLPNGNIRSVATRDANGFPYVPIADFDTLGNLTGFVDIPGFPYRIKGRFDGGFMATSGYSDLQRFGATPSVLWSRGVSNIFREHYGLLSIDNETMTVVVGNSLTGHPATTPEVRAFWVSLRNDLGQVVWESDHRGSLDEGTAYAATETHDNRQFAALGTYKDLTTGQTSGRILVWDRSGMPRLDSDCPQQSVPMTVGTNNNWTNTGRVTVTDQQSGLLPLQLTHNTDLGFLRVEDICELYRLNGVAETERGKPQPLLVWPNPAQTYLMVSVPELFEEGSLRLYDVMGRMVRELAVPVAHSSELELDLQGLPRGIYFSELRSVRGHWAAKVVKGE